MASWSWRAIMRMRSKLACSRSNCLTAALRMVNVSSTLQRSRTSRSMRLFFSIWFMRIFFSAGCIPALSEGSEALQENKRAASCVDSQPLQMNPKVFTRATDATAVYHSFWEKAGTAFRKLTLGRIVAAPRAARARPPFLLPACTKMVQNQEGGLSCELLSPTPSSKRVQGRQSSWGQLHPLTSVWLECYRNNQVGDLSLKGLS